MTSTQYFLTIFLVIIVIGFLSVVLISRYVKRELNALRREEQSAKNKDVESSPAVVLEVKHRKMLPYRLRIPVARLIGRFYQMRLKLSFRKATALGILKSWSNLKPLFVNHYIDSLRAFGLFSAVLAKMLISIKWLLLTLDSRIPRILTIESETHSKLPTISYQIQDIDSNDCE